MAEERTVLTWRSIAGLDGWYEVSNDGGVRSWKTTGAGGVHGVRAETPAILKPAIKGLGYHQYSLVRPDGRRRYVNAHVLVLETFVGPRPEGAEGCHNDGNPANNHLSNLRWDTSKANHADKKQHGTDYVGERNGRAKLTWQQVEQIRKDWRGPQHWARKNGPTQKELGVKYGVSAYVICCIVNNRNWSIERKGVH